MSSLFAALGVAVSGLGAQSQSIGNISSDIANAETTGYKSIGTNFEDIVTASSATQNNPGGVTATPNYQNDVQGNISTTSTVTNLAISGQGFFDVTSATQNAVGATVFSGSNNYTRQGDFTLNKDGYMVNSSGFYLQGYAITNNIVNTSSTVPIQISALVDNPVASSKITYAANLPASATTSYTSTPSTVNVYDALGNTHQTSVVWANTGADTWQATVTVTGGGYAVATPTDNYVAVFDLTINNATNIGTVQTLTGVSAGYYTPAGVLVTAQTAPAVSAASAGKSADVTLTPLSFSGAGTTNSLDLNLGEYDTTTGVTQFANTSSTVSVTSISTDGLGEGSFSSIGIDDNGIVSINYTNGSTRQIYQVPLALFNSPDSLQRGSGGIYTATLASGAANLYLAGTNGAGTIASESLEASDVDIANEFTTMIQAQQVYSANAKVVTTVNGMLNTIIQAVQ